MLFFPECTLVNFALGLAAVAIAFVLSVSRSYFCRMLDRFRGRVPPGPPAFPILGTITIDTKRPQDSFRKWVDQYGSLFTFYLGHRFCLGVADMELVKKLFKDPDNRFLGRPNQGIFSHLDGDVTQGILFGNGDIWKDHRRFALTALRDFGFGKASSLEHIQKEAANLVSIMRSHGGEPFDATMYFASAVANIVCDLLFSGGFEPDDPRFRQFIENVKENLRELASSGVLEVYPWLRFVYPYRKKFKGFNRRMHQNKIHLTSLVMDHKRSFNPSQPRDYIDAFFLMQSQKIAEDGNEGTFTDKQLVRNVTDLFTAGYETLSTFLRWCMVYMILHPEIQQKVQAEIDRVIGRARLPSVADKSKMPYTDAVTIEIHRRSAFVPFGIAHCSTEDADFEGYTIPKGTEIWPVICHHFMNKDIWGDPDAFRPERFIDENGHLISSLYDQVQPFSVGRRACLGEPLARVEVFCFFSSILQNFTLTSNTTPSAEAVISPVLTPPSFKIIATPR